MTTATSCSLGTMVEGRWHDMTMAELNRELGRPRASLYDDLKTIATAFADEGLRNWLD